MRWWLKPARDDYYPAESLKTLFSPQGKASQRFSFIYTSPRGVLSFCVFITWERLLNLQNISLGSYPAPPSTSIIWHVKTSCLGGGWGSMWRGDVLPYRASLIFRLSPRGSAEGQLHNRMIHHVGLAHLSPVWLLQLGRRASCQCREPVKILT